MLRQWPASLPLNAEIGRQLAAAAQLASLPYSSSSRSCCFSPSGWAMEVMTRGARVRRPRSESGANLVIFTLFASTSFLLLVIVALFAGDTVPSEASWAGLRYLLAAPVRRRAPAAAEAPGSGAFLRCRVRLPAFWTLVVGGIAYGWGPYVGPTGSQIGWPEFAGRLLIIVGYLLLAMSVVGAFAFMLGVLTDAPLAAVGARCC